MSSRTFATQAAPSAAATSQRLAEQIVRPQPSATAPVGQAGGSKQAQPKQQPPAYRPDKLVRADHRTRTMDAFVVRGAAATQQPQPGGSGPAAASASKPLVLSNEQQPQQQHHPQQQQQQEQQPQGTEEQEQQAQLGVSQHPASHAALAAVGGAIPRKRRAAEHDRLVFNSTVAQAAVAAPAADADGMQPGSSALFGAQQQGGTNGSSTAPPVDATSSGKPHAAWQRANPPGPPPVAAAREVLAARQASCHGGLAEVIKQHVFVGLADEAGEWALVQHSTRLYLVAVAPLSRDLFEQQLLRRWGRCPALALEEALPLEALATAGLKCAAAAGRWTVRWVALSHVHIWLGALRLAAQLDQCPAARAVTLSILKRTTPLAPPTRPPVGPSLRWRG